MFIHIGNNVSVPAREVVGIFDLETATTMKDSRSFLKMCEEEDFMETVLPGEMPKTVVVTERSGKSRVYLSPLAAATVRKRFDALLKEKVI